MNEFINSWKNSEIFQIQLNLNLAEISNKRNYPEHWHEFINLVETFNLSSILDVGCGCGTYYNLSKIHFPTIEYTGIDYAEEAIDLAKKTWKYDKFFVKNYLDLTKEYIQQFDLIHLGALLDILPNGDEALKSIINLEPKSILIGRMRLTENKSNYSTYKAYYKIDTYSFIHNRQCFLDLCAENNYSVYKEGNSFFLKRELGA